MDKVKMTTPDGVTENMEKLAALFPAAVTEMRGEDGTLRKGIDFEKLRQLLSHDIVEGGERYEFSWVGKKAAMAEAARPTTETLRPVKADSRDWDTTENLYIEGDNLAALKILQESYLGKVKMIYIDPPYNTGNDFIYADDFMRTQDEENEQMGMFDEDENHLFKNTDNRGRFHSDWCSNILERLLIARNFLSDDGVILINIDEHEVANMLKICSEVYGVTNELGVIVWDKRNPKGDATGISYQHEYIIVYAKDRNMLSQTTEIRRPKRNAASIIKKAQQLFAKVGATYTLEAANKDFGAWVREQTQFSGGERAYNKIDTDGNVYRPVSMAWPNKKKAPDDYFIPLIHPVTKRACPVPERGWRNPSSTMKKMLEDGLILFGKDETTIPNSKYLLKDNMYENIPSLLYYGGSDTDMLAKLGIPFDTPKSVDICKEHIQSFTQSDSIILDFFSGSATTAHAVMQLNAEDGGQRKFIMVQLPEACDEKSEAYKAGYKNICEIGKERIRRAGRKIRDDLLGNGELYKNADKAHWMDSPEYKAACKSLVKQLDIGFRCLRLDSSNMQDIYYTPDATQQDLLAFTTDNIKPDRTPEDLLFQMMLELGVLPSSTIAETEIGGKKVFDVADGFLLACFDKGVTTETVTAIAKKQPYYAVFRDASMADDSTATNFDQIFETYSPSTVRKVL